MPKMMLASGSTALWMMRAASATSCRVRSRPPVMLISTPLAPSIEVSSSSGELIARCAASSARFSPLAMPVPMSAMPMPRMIVRTSAKSTLISPGTVIRSEMPCTAWRSTSSAIRKASASGVPRSTKLSSRSFGMVISVSTASRSSSMPCSAICIRRRPSKPNGLVTTATVSAPISAASEAMIGSAPVPVPPPMPAVTKTMSAPSSSSRMLLGVLERRLPADLGVGAGAEAAGELPADLHLDRRLALGERLQVGVGGDELDAAQVGGDHPVDGVAAAAADADHLDLGGHHLPQ